METKNKTKAKMNTKNSNAKMKRPSNVNPEKGSTSAIAASRSNWFLALLKKHPYWIGAILLILLILLIILIIVCLKSSSPTSDTIDKCLVIHNKYREKHGAPPMKISSDVCTKMKMSHFLIIFKLFLIS